MEPERVADRLAVAAAAALVGRAREQEQLRAWVAHANGPSAVFVHGPVGIGKTALLAGTIAGPTTVALDGREVEPTPVTVLAHLGSVLGLTTEAPTLEQVAHGFADASIVAFVIDNYERLGVVDGWMRNRLLPSLPATTTTVLVGRNPPNVAWRSAPGWRQLIAEFRVGPLTEAAAAELVERHGLTADLAERARRFGRGHPLALELACEALERHPDLEMSDVPLAEVVEQLVSLLFDDLEPEARDIVEAAAVLRRITVPTLAAVLSCEEADARDAWNIVRDLPFTTEYRDGLELQPVVQDALVTRLELQDPARARELRRRAARFAFGAAAASPGWSATADLLHLVRNPIVRSGFLPPMGAQHPVETATEGDLGAVLEITERHLGPDECGRVEQWWRHHPDRFSVARAPDGGVQAFRVAVESDVVSAELREHDPAAAAMVADLRARPLRRDGRALINRRMLSAERGARPSPELSLMIVDLKRTYLEMRPHLMRVYDTAPRAGPLAPLLGALGFVPLEGHRSVDLWSLDLPPGSVDAWIAAHIEVESSGGFAEPPADVSGRLASLSAREREVLGALADGLTNRELAERLFISERTANRHLSNIFTKLGVHNRTVAARLAIDGGLAS